MATVIKPKRSESAGSNPTTSDIAVGEIAVNTADKQIFIRDSSDNIVQLGGGILITGNTSNAVSTQNVLTGTTTDATETEIFIGGVSNSRVSVANNSTVMYSVDIVARRTDSDGVGAGYHLKGIIDHKILYGSWAGAFGNFQFMPRTIRNYAIDYNKNKTIELKKVEDSFASAANYLKSIGWKKNRPCFYKIELKENIPKKYLNSSARDIKNKRKIKFLKKYIVNFNNLNIEENYTAAIIIPDKDIIPGAETLSPAYVVFENYEKILNWNRSLRFALAVCTLKERFNNEI
mgnify:CR=1 FL=1